jgi:hypothetical protein
MGKEGCLLPGYSTGMFRLFGLGLSMPVVEGFEDSQWWLNIFVR